MKVKEHKFKAKLSVIHPICIECGHILIKMPNSEIKSKNGQFSAMYKCSNNKKCKIRVILNKNYPYVEYLIDKKELDKDIIKCKVVLEEKNKEKEENLKRKKEKKRRKRI